MPYIDYIYIIIYIYTKPKPFIEIILIIYLRIKSMYNMYLVIYDGQTTKLVCNTVE